ERCVPLLRIHCVPSFGEPELRASVGAVFHEGEILRAGDGTRREREGLQEESVARRFVVVCEAFAGVTDLGESAGEVEPAQRRGAPLEFAAFCVRGMEWIGPEGMLDVVAEQLLVLLLVMDAQLDALGRLG